MPKITDPNVIEVLENTYFDHHVAMHLCREGMIANPGDACSCCRQMSKVGEPGSGTDFLNMHHEMIRVFRFLLKGITYKPSQTWDLDRPEKLPREILALFQETDPRYVADVFKGVHKRIANAGTDEDIDELGIFIERGNERERGAGFHNTLHDYLGSMEGGFARGAEMNKLRNSMYNDYFWSLHFWIDGQYQRIAERLGKIFKTSPLDPKLAEFTAKDDHPKQKSHTAHG